MLYLSQPSQIEYNFICLFKYDAYNITTTMSTCWANV